MPEGFITDFAHNTDIMQKTDNAQRTLKDVIERIDWTGVYWRKAVESLPASGDGDSETPLDPGQRKAASPAY